MIIVAVAFWLGWKINELLMISSFRRIMEDLKISQSRLEELARSVDPTATESEDQPKGEEIQIKVEEVQGQLLAFEVTKDSFVAQGTTPDDLLSRIIEKYPPGTRITVDNDKGGDMIRAAAERMKV